MKQTRLVVVNLVLGLLVAVVIPAHAQQPPPRLLTLHSTSGLATIPVMEGWYPNEDGSVTITFGFSNRNEDDVVTVPLGVNNFIEPTRFNGMQPTHFDAGRHVGVFSVTLPAEMRGESVWWHLRTGNGDLLKVPGRGLSAAYELDRRPRPQGSVQPEAWFEEGGEKGTGPEGLIADRQGTVSVGTEVTLTAHANDPSVRDPTDPRFAEPLAVRLHWFKHQGPGNVVFTRHASTPEPVVDEDDDNNNNQRRRRRRPPGPEVVSLTTGNGTGNVIATFSEPGEYLLRILVENWSAPDSSAGNQCCWTNIYQRVTVEP